jgi:hypothetical protein
MFYPSTITNHNNISFQFANPAKHLQVGLKIFNIEAKLMEHTQNHFYNTSRFIDFPSSINFNRLSSGIYFYQVAIKNEYGEEDFQSKIFVKHN